MEQMQEWFVCHVDDLPATNALCFQVSVDKRQFDAFIIFWHEQWYAYKNACPHTGVNLNWLPDVIFDSQGEYLQCSVHGALFDPQNGQCLHGPCIGESLERLPCFMRDDMLYIKI